MNPSQPDPRQPTVDYRALADPLPSTTAGSPPEQESTVDAPVEPIPGLHVSIAGSGERYRAIKSHARGGLGEVLVAEDTELRRVVALKRLQERRADDPACRHRFLREAEITGRLEHPGIVPVYGLVADAEGRPCYAMRFIEGRSLHEAVRDYHARKSTLGPGERALGLRELLGHFVAACNAIAYAHSKGVIHRDVKPANIMLGKFGETLVVDWGLAKAGFGECGEPTSAAADDTLANLGADTNDPMAGTPTPELTEQGQAVGTPAFMAPEQAEGRWDRVGPASDVYSLGATLYDLLTGQTPFGRAPVPETLARVRRGDLPWPRQLDRSVPAALDAICRKAMAREPEGRYASALELAADVNRWLADEPVRAYPEPLPARLRRWGRRHRTLVSALAVLLVTSTAALGLGLYQVNRAWGETDFQRQAAVQAQQAEARSAAEARERLVLALTGFRRLNLEITEYVSSSPDADRIRNSLLKHPLESLQEFTRLAESAEGVERETVKAHFLLGEIFALNYDWPAARRHYAAACRILEALSRADPEDESLRQDLMQAYRELGSAERSGRAFPEAAATYRRALEVQWLRMRAAPEKAHLRHELADLRGRLGDVLRDLGDPTAAEREYRGAMAELQASLPGCPPELRTAIVSLIAELESRIEPDKAEVRRRNAERHESAADAEAQRGRLAAARDIYRGALTELIASRAGRPADRDSLRREWGLHTKIGEASRGLNDNAAAHAAFTLALQTARVLVSADPADPASRRSLVASLLNVGDTAFQRQDIAGARAVYEEAASLIPTGAAGTPADPSARRHRQMAFDRLGELEMRAGRYPEARDRFREALAIRREMAEEEENGPRVWRELAQLLGKVGDASLRAKDRVGARAAYQERLRFVGALVKAEPGSSRTQLDVALGSLAWGDLSLELNDFATARQSYGHGIAILTHLCEAAPNNVVFRRQLAGACSRASRVEQRDFRFPEAVCWLERAKAVMDDLAAQGRLKDRPADAAWARKLGPTLGYCLRAWQAAEDPAFARAQPPVVVADLLSARAIVLARRGKLGEALATVEEMIARAPDDLITRFTAVTCLAQCVPAMGAGLPLPFAPAVAGPVLQERCAARAVGMLRSLYVAGYFRTDSSLLQLQEDPFLNPLRGRADFRKLLADVMTGR